MPPPSGFNAALCITYQQDEDRESVAKVKSKGLNSLIKYNETRTCDKLKEYLVKQVDQEFPCVKVHKNCRRNFTNSLRKSPTSIQTNETNESFNLSLRSEDSNKFKWKAYCFFVWRIHCH